MEFTKVEDLSEAQLALLKKLKKGPPTYLKGWETLSIIATTAQEVLSDPMVGRDKFTMQAVIDRISGGHPTGREMPVGTIYRYFKNRLDLLDFVWPDRRDTFLH